MGKKQIKINVNGKPFVVEVGDLTAAPIQVVVNGKEYEVSIESGAALAAVTQTSAAAQPADQPAAVPASRAAQSAPSGTGKEFRAPMPGKIFEVNVKPGEKVQPGQQICSLEAMKMKSAVRTPREGVIASVAVHEGQKVAYNDILVVFE